MALLEFLASKQDAIAAMWLDRLVATYPNDANGLLKGKRDQFANPMAHTMAEAIGAITEALFDDADLKRTIPYLEKLVKFRAVQDFSPSEAVSFIFLFKDVVRAFLKDAASIADSQASLAEIDKRVDALMLFAFDVYTHYRERLCEIRVNEAKRHVSGLLRRLDRRQDVEHKLSAGGGQ